MCDHCVGLPSLMPGSEYTKPIMRSPIERADQDAAAHHGDGEDRHRHDFVVARPPDFALELDDCGEILERGEVAVGEWLIIG